MILHMLHHIRFATCRCNIPKVILNFFKLHILSDARLGIGWVSVDMLGMSDVRAEILAGNIVAGYIDVALLSHRGRIGSLDEFNLALLAGL